MAEKDARISAGLDLVEARSDEFLFEPDMDVVCMRRRIRDAFLSQLDGKRIPVAPVAPDASVRRPPHRSGFG